MGRLLALLSLACIVGTCTPALASKHSEPARQQVIPIKASLGARIVAINDQESLRIITSPHARVFIRVLYPVTGGFKKRGTADLAGVWEHTWIVRAQRPGQAVIAVIVTIGSLVRRFNVRFAVTPAPTATPVPTIVIAPAQPPTDTPTATLEPTITDTPATQATPTATETAFPENATITLDSIDFYTQFNASGPVGTPQTEFTVNTPAIYDFVAFSRWQGSHTVVHQWYDPSGALYYSRTDLSTDNGPADSVSFVAIAGQDAETKTGVWTVKILVDGTEAATKQFTLSPAATIQPFSTPTATATATPLPTETGTITPTVTGTITITPTGTAVSASQLGYQGTSFYDAVDAQGNPTGSPQTQFPTATQNIYAVATFTNWQGSHTAQFNFTSPAGNTYPSDVVTATHTGAATVNGALPLSTIDPGEAQGVWTVDLTVDGATIDEQTFTVSD